MRQTTVSNSASLLNSDTQYERIWKSIRNNEIVIGTSTQNVNNAEAMALGPLIPGLLDQCEVGLFGNLSMGTA